ncbi:protein eyes shut homolog [Ciona intestinalis]
MKLVWNLMKPVWNQMKPTGVEPVETGLKPDETSLEPEETKPDETSLEPDETGVEPVETGLKPDETSLEPEETKPDETNETSLEPDETSLEPEETKPDETSLEPDETSLKPDETSVEPDETSLEPDETGLEPDETSFEPQDTNLEIDIGCLQIKCLNGGTCLETDNSWICVCNYGWRGKHCDVIDNSMNTSKTVAFSENKDLPSFVTFPIPNGLEHSTILRLKFLAKDMSQDGLLMFLGDITMDTDYFIIDIVNQTIRLRYNLGGGEFALSSERLNNIYDVYDLLVQRHGANATMQVNNMTHVKITTSSKFQDFNFNSNSELRLGWVNGQPQFVGCILSLQVNVPENKKKCWKKKQTHFSELSKWVELLGTKGL